MTAPLDPASVALQRSPTVRQEVQVEPETGRLFAIVDGYLRIWNRNGTPLNFMMPADEDGLFLTPLQTAPKALRCWALVRNIKMVSTTTIPPRPQMNTDAPEDWREMIERAPAEALADAVDKLLICGGSVQTALRAYRAMYPKEDGK